MNCGTCRECKINIWIFEKFGFVNFKKKDFSFVSKVFWLFGVFEKEIVIFNIGFGFVVFESIW